MMADGTDTAMNDASSTTIPPEDRKRPLADIENMNTNNNSNKEELTPPKVPSSAASVRRIQNPYSSTKKKPKKPTPGKDEECLVISPPPPRPSQTSNTTNDNNEEDEDCVMEWTNAKSMLVDYAHGRPDCGVHDFSNEDQRVNHCDKCYCVVCEVKAEECTQWAEHCQKTKNLKRKQPQEEDSSDEEEEEEEAANVINLERMGGGATQSYNTRARLLARMDALARGRGDLHEDEEEARLDRSAWDDHQYTNKFNHGYNTSSSNNNGGKRERSPKDMKITEVLAQKLHEALSLSEGGDKTTGPVDGGFASRSEVRKQRFDACKTQGDIPQLGLHKSFFVEGIRIGWPYPSILKPQRQMAIHLIKALKNSRHVVLESPTGTGKSAAILCSVLAWQRHHAKTVWGKTVGPTANAKMSVLETMLEQPLEKFPRIIYCSRTHSQVAQMVSSLKKTPYRPRMTVLGSRKQFCIHKSIQDQSPKSDEDDESKNKPFVPVDTACQMRVANTEKIRKSLWKSYDFHYNDDRPPEELPGDGDGGMLSQGDEDDEAEEDLASSEWILKNSTKKLTCPHYRQLSSARNATMTRNNFLVSQKTIDCCTSGGDKTKLGVADIEDLVNFGVDPYLHKSVVLYRRDNQENFGMSVGIDCRIRAIRDGSPAKSSGELREGDKILEVNGKRVPNINMLQNAIKKTTQDMLDLKVLRKTSPRTSSPFQAANKAESTLKEVDVFLNRPLGQKSFGMTLQGTDRSSKGCRVNTVKAGGAAAKDDKVKEGDLIVAVNGINVENMSYDGIIAKIIGTHKDPLRLKLRREVAVDDNAESENDESDEDPYSPHSACPYYTSRALSKHAELLFAPYNYVLDPGIRSALDISLEGAVVVLDEGHNCEGVLTESGSGKFGEIELSFLMAVLSNYASASKSYLNLIDVNGEEVDRSEIAHELLLFVEKLVLHMREKKTMFEQSTGAVGASKAIEDYIKFNTSDTEEFEVSYSGPNGHGVMNKAVGCQPFFDGLEISAKEVEKLTEYAKKLSESMKGNDETRGSGGRGENERGRDVTADLLVEVVSKLGLAIQKPEHFYISCVIQPNGNFDHAAGEEADRSRARGGRFRKKPKNYPFILPRSATNPNALISVCTNPKCKQSHAGSTLLPAYGVGVRHGEWCDGTVMPAWEAHLKVRLLFPGLLMEELATQCRTVVLASGSISPLPSICAELDLRGSKESTPGRLQTVPRPLEADHVINLQNQLFACSVGTFPDGSKLNVNWKNYNQPQFLPRLGAAIASIIESIPSGGVLVFLPSYSLLNKCMKCWNPSEFGGFRRYNQNDNSSPEVYDRLVRSKGKVIVEPTGSQEAFEEAREEYNETIREYGNCILFAVFRGKMSEGISFNDEFARGVICVGLPLPGFRDRNISAKRAYNNEQRKLKQRTNLLPGDEWYSQEAYRALSQALGRCIRHEGDYGSIILLDSRHCHDGSPTFSHKKLPKWMRHSVRTLSHGNRGFGDNPVVGGYSGLKREMERFFAQAPAYAGSVLEKRRKEYEEAKKRENSSSLQYDSKKGWISRSSSQPTKANMKREAPQSACSTDSKPITQDSPMPASSTRRMSVVDLCTPESVGPNRRTAPSVAQPSSSPAVGVPRLPPSYPQHAASQQPLPLTHPPFGAGDAAQSNSPPY